MAKAEKRRDLFTATEVARFCQVDLKTIHNWADRDDIRHFRTPGRHLRFQRVDVLDFLRKYGYPIPDEIGADRPLVTLLGDSADLDPLLGALGTPFETKCFDNAFEALIAIGAKTPDALVISGQSARFDLDELLTALSRAEVTRHVRVVLVGGADTSLEAKLADRVSAQVKRGDGEELRATLEALLGVGR